MYICIEHENKRNEEALVVHTLNLILRPRRFVWSADMKNSSDDEDIIPGKKKRIATASVFGTKYNLGKYFSFPLRIPWQVGTDEVDVKLLIIFKSSGHFVHNYRNTIIPPEKFHSTNYLKHKLVQ